MTQTPYILWAVLATGISFTALALAERQRRWSSYWYKEATECLNKWGEAAGRCDTWRSIAIALQDKIDRDAAKRSSITSRGNRTRAANRRAKVLEQASKLVVPKIDRIAA